MKIPEDSYLFREVKSVLGHEEAVKHLTIATEKLSEDDIQFIIEYDVCLAFAFPWETTKQGSEFWGIVYKLVSKYGVEE